MTDHSTINDTLAKALLEDKRSDRRWKIIRTFLWVFVALLYAFFLFSPQKAFQAKQSGHGYVSLVRLDGVIMPGTSFSASKALKALNRAFADRDAKGVVLVINSPGGSPVQASIIHDRIEYLKHRFKKKVVVVGEDALASGAYLVSTAGDKIYVQNDTLTGSIGVIMSGFGFTDAIKKLGIERRVYTAGDNKDRLDAFRHVLPRDKKKVEKVLADVHHHFIQYVIEGRGKRLSRKQGMLFSGDFWSGHEAVKLGLADGVGNTWEVIQKEFKVTRYKNYTLRPSLLHTFLYGVQTALHLALIQHDARLSEKLT